MIRSPVVISIGDPSGIGPEVFLKSIINTELRDNLEKITVICDPTVLTNTLSGLDESLEINIVADHNQNARDAVNVICSEKCPEYQLGLSEPKTSKYTLNSLIYAAIKMHGSGTGHALSIQETCHAIIGARNNYSNITSLIIQFN